MKRIFAVAVFVVAGLAIVAGMILRAVDNPQPVQAQGQSVMVVQATASPQPTATASPMPTVDYQQVWPAQTQAAAAYELAQAQERIARAAATMARATEQAYQSALIAGTPTAQARATEQAEATTQAQEAAEATATAQENSRIDNKIMMDAKVEQTAQDIRFVLWVAGVAVLFVLVVTGIRMLDYRAKTALFVAATGAATSNPLEHIAPVTDAPAGFIPVGASTSHPTRVPVPPEVFAVWARRMLDGGTAGINKWETGDSPFSRNAENGKPAYIPFLDWAIERGYVAESGGAKVLSERGQLFCRGWLQRRGSPPLAAEVPETAENPMNHAMPCPPEGVAEGDGLGKDEG